MDLSISFSFCSQFSIIQQISRVDYHVLVLMYFTEGSLADEQLDGFSNVVTNSGGAVIGGSCGTGGVFLLCVDLSCLKSFHFRFAPKMRCGVNGNWSDDMAEFVYSVLK